AWKALWEVVATLSGAVAKRDDSTTPRTYTVDVKPVARRLRTVWGFLALQIVAAFALLVASVLLFQKIDPLVPLPLRQDWFDAMGLVQQIHKSLEGSDKNVTPEKTVGDLETLSAKLRVLNVQQTEAATLEALRVAAVADLRPRYAEATKALESVKQALAKVS